MGNTVVEKITSLLVNLKLVPVEEYLPSIFEFETNSFRRSKYIYNFRL